MPPKKKASHEAGRGGGGDSAAGSLCARDRPDGGVDHPTAVYAIEQIQGFKYNATSKGTTAKAANSIAQYAADEPIFTAKRAGAIVAERMTIGLYWVKPSV